MKIHHLSNTAIIIGILLACIPGLSGCKCNRGAQSSLSEKSLADLYYETVRDSASVDWQENISVFHYWREIAPEEYLFDVPSAEQISAWELLCEKENDMDSEMRLEVQGYCLNMNQFMTIQDFFCVHGEDDAFIAWRLQQYYLNIDAPKSEYERFQYLKNAIQSLCDYKADNQMTMNIHAGLKTFLEEFYCRMIHRRAVHHSDNRLAAALLKENEAWEAYHAQLSPTFYVLNSENRQATLWSMAESWLHYNDAITRESSLIDFYLAITDGRDYEFQHHPTMPGASVLQEYRKFIDEQEEVEEEFASTLAEKKRELEKEMEAWKNWMLSRREISSQLNGFVKDVFDNSTNNVIRAKYLILKDREQYRLF